MRRPPIILLFLFVFLFGVLGLSEAIAEDGATVEVVPTVPHAQIVNSIAFSQDGARLVSGDVNGILKIWDVRTRKLIRTFENGYGEVHAVAFSPSGKEVFAGRDGWSLQLIDTASGKTIQSFRGSDGTIKAAAFSPDGHQLATGGANNDAYLWDVQSGRLLFHFEGHASGVYSVAFTPDGKQLLTASFDQTLRVWDTAKGTLLRTLPGSRVWRYWNRLRGAGPDRDEDLFISVAVSPDGAKVLSGSWGKVRNVKLWDFATGELLKVYEGQRDSVAAVGFSADGGRIFAAGEDGKLVIWNTGDGSLVRTIESRAKSVVVRTAVMAPNGLLATGSGPELWDAASGAYLGGFGTGLRNGFSLRFTPDAARLVSAADNGAAIWDVVNGRLIRTVGNHGGEVAAVDISPDGSRVLTGARDNTAKLWDAATGALLQTFASPPSSVWGDVSWVEAAALSPSGDLAASGGTDNLVRVWDVKTGSQLHGLRSPLAYITVLAFSADGKRLLCGSWDGSVSVWDPVTGKQLFEFETENRRLYNPKQNDREQSNRAISWAGFSGDGARILAVTHSGALTVWDAHTGREIERHPSVSGYAVSFAVSPGGKSIYVDGAYSIDEKDAATGKIIRELKGQNISGHIVLAPDGRKLASVTSDRAIRIWDTNSGAHTISLFNGIDGEWAAFTRQGFFNASSPKAKSLVSLVKGLETTSISQTWQSLYAPDLIREALAGDPDSEVSRAAEVVNLEKVVGSGPAPLVELEPIAADRVPDNGVVEFSARIRDQGTGVGRIEWRINGITAGVTAPQNDRGSIFEAKQTLALDPGENVIEAVAYNKRNLLASLPGRMTLTYKSAGDSIKSKLHILAVGINDYVDEGWTAPGRSDRLAFPKLRLAVRDATSFAEEAAKASGGLYSDVRVRTVLDAEATPAGLARVIKDMAAEISPRDTFIFYAAAHGYSEQGRFYLIPQDYQGGDNPDALASLAIGQETIQDWVANKIKAKKVIILLDTCESGALVSGYMKSRVDAPASEAALGRLNEATGRPVLTAAAEGKPAFEGYEGHGVFTWALLDALHHGDTNGNGVIEVSELAAHVQTMVPKISAQLNGRGRAAIAVRGSTTGSQSAHFGGTGGDFPLVSRLP